MSWLSKYFPTIFIDAPDGTIHFRIEGICVLKSKDNFKRIYSFKYNKIYSLENELENRLIQSTKNITSKLEDVILDNSNKETKVYIQEEKISYLEKIIQGLREEKNNLMLDSKEDIKVMLKLRAENATCQTIINNINNTIKEKNSEKENIIKSNLNEKEELRKWYLEELEKREEIIKSLREIINKFREDIQIISNEMNTNNSINIDKVRKEIELLDRDFVDVAKAMRIYSKDENRPQKGFRINL
jgi:hypothetical protein